MNLVYFLLPASIVLGLIAVGGFIWCVKKGQLDDLETPAQRILFDDEDKREIK
jgi:cbb3-type cytochrome oxidase maturation protein